VAIDKLFAVLSTQIRVDHWSCSVINKRAWQMRFEIDVACDDFGRLFSVLEDEFGFEVKHKSILLQILSMNKCLVFVYKYSLTGALVLGSLGCLASIALYPPATFFFVCGASMCLAPFLTDADSTTTLSIPHLVYENMPEITISQTNPPKWLPIRRSLTGQDGQTRTVRTSDQKSDVQQPVETMRPSDQKSDVLLLPSSQQEQTYSDTFLSGKDDDSNVRKKTTTTNTTYTCCGADNNETAPVAQYIECCIRCFVDGDRLKCVLDFKE